MDADEEHPISFDILRKTVRKWKEVGAKDNYFFRYTLSIREINSMSFLSVLYKKYLYYFDYLKLDGMWELDGSHVLDAERNPYTTRIGYRYESGYELHEAGLLAVEMCIRDRLRTSTVERFTEEKSPEGTSWKTSIRAREEGGKTLTKTTQLKNSIRSEVSDGGLAVGTNDIRAATHQFGDERTIRAKNKKYLTFKVLSLIHI